MCLATGTATATSLLLVSPNSGFHDSHIIIIIIIIVSS
jgi:hypothetical protein